MTEPTLLALHRQKIVALEAEVARFVQAAADLVFEWDVDPTDATGHVAQTVEGLRALVDASAERINRLDEVFGKWPGNEDEAALLAQLRALDGKDERDG